MKPNGEIRNLIRVSGICSWQVAERLGIHENSLYRMLRKELDSQDKNKIYQAIEELKTERDAEISRIHQVN